MNAAQLHAIVAPHVSRDIGVDAKWGSYVQLSLREEDRATMHAQYMGEVRADDETSRFVVTEFHDGSHSFAWN